MSKKQIVMSEERLRNFISYSVAKLLKEAYGRPIYDAHGEYDGSEESDYGEDSLVFEPDIDEYLSDEVDFPSPIKVEVNYTRTEGMKGDGYMQPDDPDDYEIDSWRIINNDIPMEVRQEVMRAVKMYMENDFDIEEAVSEYGNIYEENRGVMAHFNGEGFKPKNPYEDMTWDEYCAAKAREREEDAEEKRFHDLNYPEGEKENRGITTHFGGEKHEKTPEEVESDEHMFDDDYWAKKEKVHVSKDEILEMIQNAIRNLKEGVGEEEEPVVDNFPKKASGSFTMNTRRGNTDKYRVFVEKTDDAELLTDIFIYDPMDKEWYPQAEYVVDIEEYTNGTWLPYWETFNGDVSIRALANCFNKVVKLWKKVGYLFDEDDEIPFRYSGDIKGFGGKIYESKVNEGIGDSRVAYWKIQNVLKYIENRMNDIEKSYGEAEEDPGMNDEYAALSKAKEALEGLGEYLL